MFCNQSNFFRGIQRPRFGPVRWIRNSGTYSGMQSLGSEVLDQPMLASVADSPRHAGTRRVRHRGVLMGSSTRQPAGRVVLALILWRFRWLDGGGKMVK